MGRYRFRDDIVIADRAVEVSANDLDDLFATSARALCDLMADPDSLGRGRTQDVSVSAESLDLLLVDFLTELLVLKDRDRALFPEARVRVHEGGGGSPVAWELTATLRGEVVDPDRTRRRVDVKAVTLHQLAVEREAEGWHARFVVDL